MKTTAAIPASWTSGIKIALFAATSGIALISAVAPAHAQSAGATGSTGNQGEIVVTASRITASGFSAPTPTTVIGADAIAKQASPSLFQAITELPSLAGSTGTTANNGNTSTGATGLSALNMRDLGYVRTLTLLDGQRVVGSNVNGINDTNLFPQLLVQRVDVVNGGASASWGSDAISGVVNFVTDKKFQGFKANVELSDSTYNDDQNGLFQVAAGRSFLGDKLHVEGDAEYYNSAGVGADENGGIGINGRPDSYRAGSTNYSLTGSPQTPAGLPQYYYYPHNAQGNTYGGNGLITKGGALGTAFGPGGVPYPFQYGTNPNGTVGPSGFVGGTEFGGEQSNSTANDNTLDSPIQRELFYTRASYDITSRIEAYGTFLISDVKTSNQPNTGAPKNGLTIQCSNAFLPASVSAQCPGGATGGGTLGFGTNNNSFPAYIKVNNDRSLYRWVFGADGSFDLFGKPITFDAYVGHGVDTTNIHIENMTLTPLYNDAIDAINLNGQIVCRSAAARAAGCLPWNPFGAVSNSAAAFKWFTPANGPYEHAVQGEDEASASLNATPFKNWAGDVSIAAGIDYRQEYYTLTADPYGNGVSNQSPNSGVYPVNALLLSTGTNWFAGNYHNGAGKYSVLEGFFEVGLPLWDSETFGKANADGAFRGTNYSTSGYVDTWKAGGTWDTPIEGLRIRGTQSRDIRAPNLNELFTAPTTVQNSVINPQNSQTVQAPTVTVGNTNLKPEISDNTEVGFVYRPHFVPGLSFSVDYFNISVSGAIATLPSAQSEVNLCYQGETQYCSNVKLTGAVGTSDLPFVRLQAFNLASLKTDGLDIEASYRFNLQQWNIPGDFTLRGLVTRTFNLTSNSGIPGQIVQQYAGYNSGGNTDGQYGVPYWKAYIPESWTYGKITITAVERIISDGSINPNYITCTTGCPAPTVQHPTTNFNFVPGAVYFDLGGSYDLTKQTTVYFKIDNVTNDLAPPFAAPTLYDTVGRMYRIGFRMNY